MAVNTEVQLHRPNSASVANQHRGILGRFIPYFRNAENVLKAKTDATLLVWVVLAGIMKELDQTATTQAYVSGMREDLNLYGNELVWFQTYFSIAYAITIIPSQMLQSMFRPSLILPIAEMSWGLVTLFTFMAKNAQTVYALRFLLGILSATSWPGITALLFNWYTPSELAVRLAIFGVSDVAGAMFLGIIQAELYRNMNGTLGLAGWQWLFIISGILTIVIGSFGLIFVPDSPANTRAIYLTAAERRLALERIERHGTEPARLVSFRVVLQKTALLLRHSTTWLYIAAFAQNMWASKVNQYIMLYLEKVRDAEGNRVYDTYQVNIIPLGGYALQIVSVIGFNALGDWKHWRWQIHIGLALVHIVATSLLTAWPDSHGVIMFAFFLSYCTLASAAPAIIAWISEILRAEPEARAIVVGLAVVIVYVGHATIPLGIWKVSDAPQYPKGYPTAIGLTIGSMIAVLTLRFWFLRRYPDFPDQGYNGRSSPEVAEDKLESADVEAKGGSSKEIRAGIE